VHSHALIVYPVSLSPRRVTCRYDPGTTLQDDIDTPAERVQFLESIAHALFLKARLKLNIKRLYAADGRAVHELLKVTDLLFSASQQANMDAEVRIIPALILCGVLLDGWQVSFIDCLPAGATRPQHISDKETTMQDISRGTKSAFEELGHMDRTVKCVREIVSDINRAGQEIHTHLACEPELSINRQQILGQHADKADIDRALQVLFLLLDSIDAGALSPGAELHCEQAGGEDNCLEWYRMQWAS
jgi:hypothetical protein